MAVDSFSKHYLADIILKKKIQMLSVHRKVVLPALFYYTDRL